MRTKTLLLMAAIGMAGLSLSMAQVYSVNAVGYVNVDIDSGFKIVANPLNAGGNMLSEVIPSTTTGVQALMWNGSGFTPSAYIEGVGWTQDLPFPPGVAMFMTAPAATTITFVGEVPQGVLSTDLPAGFSLKGSPVPQSASLLDLGFPAVTGDQILFWTGTGYAPSAYIEGVAFTGRDTPAVAEGFFVQNPGADKVWTRTFSVNE
jgi:hypothetical protein